MPAKRAAMPEGYGSGRPLQAVMDDIADDGPRVPVTVGNSVTPDTSPTKANPRQHVKLAAPLADELRDAVWFLSEHGRPRVQLGELLDEAVAAWLNEVKGAHNGGEAFPHRGRLR